MNKIKDIRSKCMYIFDRRQKMRLLFFVLTILSVRNTIRRTAVAVEVFCILSVNVTGM